MHLLVPVDRTTVTTPPPAEASTVCCAEGLLGLRHLGLHLLHLFHHLLHIKHGSQFSLGSRSVMVAAEEFESGPQDEARGFAP